MQDDQSTALLKSAIEKAISDPAFSALLAKHIETSIRDTLGGERHYIRASSKENRNNRIRIDSKLGITPVELEDKYSLSRTQIYAILGDEK